MSHATRVLEQLKQAEADEDTPEDLREQIAERRRELESEQEDGDPA